ncbi:MAG TPA: glycosyltransferase family 2 protein, partial [Polyangiaceae bacterium]|nr:glycosyltransferase family 2 protein [Polyangiaceae bacterium]
MRLLIAIPALNEEASIKSIIERTLAAREHIQSAGGISGVDITVVSDGSTDNTIKFASEYTDRIKLIVFEKNRGYGAAIKEAWAQSDAELLGFLDADGTCDPRFFADLCRLLESKSADLALGCRLNPDSKMPLIRRVGNVIFALLLTMFSSKHVRDTASGMRVVKKSSLFKLFPLPDGLHFTPSMSARALLRDDVICVEKDMPYHEREGRSKLHVIRDGFRFLGTILQAALLYRPSRALGLGAVVFGVAATGLMLQPIYHWLIEHNVAEWMIYRFIVAQLCATAAVLLAAVSYLSRRIVMLVLSIPASAMPRMSDWVTRFFTARATWAVPVGLIIAALLLVWSDMVERVEVGTMHLHWSRWIAMSSFSVWA